MQDYPRDHPPLVYKVAARHPPLSPRPGQPGTLDTPLRRTNRQFLGGVLNRSHRARLVVFVVITMPRRRDRHVDQCQHREERRLDGSGFADRCHDRPL